MKRVSFSLEQKDYEEIKQSAKLIGFGETPLSFLARRSLLIWAARYSAAIKEKIKKPVVEVVADPELPEKLEIVNRLKKKELHGYGVGKYTCQWCGIQTIRPEKHHFPVTEKKGGNETVSICATCHTEYHWLLRIPKERRRLYYDRQSKSAARNVYGGPR